MVGRSWRVERSKARRDQVAVAIDQAAASHFIGRVSHRMPGAIDQVAASRPLAAGPVPVAVAEVVAAAIFVSLREWNSAV